LAGLPLSSISSADKPADLSFHLPGLPLSSISSSDKPSDLSCHCQGSRSLSLVLLVNLQIYLAIARVAALFISSPGKSN
jgi:hypothetical protein